MILTAECMQCLLKRHLDTAGKLGDDRKAAAFARALMKMLVDGPEDMAAPFYSPQIAALFQEHYGLPYDRYQEEKKASNRFALEHMEQLEQFVRRADDPLYAGLQCAILGNYLDFSALQREVDFEVLDQMLAQAEKIQVDAEAFAALGEDLQRSKSLLYLTDNAGEIGFDRVFAQQIQRQFPHLSITFCVRGGPALNDATREDAQAVGLPFPVIDNGNCIAGTVMELASPELKEAMERADVILAKGQANVETLLGCGRNVYYAFLVKCPRFVRLFDRPKLTPMLYRERRGK